MTIIKGKHYPTLYLNWMFPTSHTYTQNHTYVHTHIHTYILEHKWHKYDPATQDDSVATPSPQPLAMTHLWHHILSYFEPLHLNFPIYS